MRDLQLQTPQRDQTSAIRRSKSTPDVKRNLRKIAKKSLSTEFTAVLEEDDTSVAESQVDNPFGESTEVKPVDTPQSEISILSDLTSPSSTVTCDENVVTYASDNKCEVPTMNSLDNIKSIEAEMVINCLREARIQVLKSKDLGHSRNLLDALVNVIVEEFSDGVYEENGWLDKLLLRKANLVFPTFMVWILVIFVIWFFSFGSEGLYTGPLPT